MIKSGKFSSSSRSTMGGTVEEEIKLVVSAKKKFNQIKLDHLLEKQAVGEWVNNSMLTIYLDTSNRYLLKKRVAMRLREPEPGVCILGMKGFGSVINGVAKRLEWEQNLTNPPKSFYSSLHYSDISKGVVKDKLDMLFYDLGGVEDLTFTTLMKTSIERQTRQFVLADGSRVEMALDWGIVQAGERESVIGEVEIEKISGSSQSFSLFAREFMGRYGLSSAENSKFTIGLNLLGLT
ncbi:MAG: CYTH domain-containing protein [Magnetococcales bacterium]|nr:CYTH domain-containing protein [Magnetococcales bacterium]